MPCDGSPVDCIAALRPQGRPSSLGPLPGRAACRSSDVATATLAGMCRQRGVGAISSVNIGSAGIVGGSLFSAVAKRELRREPTASRGFAIEQGAPPLPAMASHMVSVSPSRSASADRRAPGNGLAIYFNVADPSVAPTCCPSGASCVRLHVLYQTCDVGTLAPVAHDRPERCWGCPPGAAGGW
jgi:hypothetical protein